MNEILLKKLSKIKMIVSDVDGILTDGTIMVSKNTEFKTFHVEDALATSLLRLADIPISFISARYSEATTARLNELKIEHIFQGYINKVSALEKIIKLYNIEYKDILYIGDGYVDMPVMKKVGFSVSVPNGHTEVKELADYITEKLGGQGVLVEVVQKLLKAKGIYKDIFKKMKKHIYEA